MSLKIIERKTTTEVRKKFLSSADVVIHLAGINRDTNMHLHKGNADATMRLLEEMRHFCPKAKLIFASSTQAEDDSSLYGLTKRYAETLIRWYAHTYGMHAVIFRFPNIFGPFCRPFYNSVVATYIYEIIHQRGITINGDGTQLRDYLYVTDAVFAIERAMKYKQKQCVDVFHLSSGKLRSINELVAELEKILGKTITKKYLPVSVKETGTIQPSSPINRKLHWKSTMALGEGIKHILKEEYKIHI